MTKSRSILELFIPEMAIQVPDGEIEALKRVIATSVRIGRLPKDAVNWIPKAAGPAPAAPKVPSKPAAPPSDGGETKAWRGVGAVNPMARSAGQGKPPQTQASVTKGEPKAGPGDDFPDLPAPRSANVQVPDDQDGDLPSVGSGDDEDDLRGAYAASGIGDKEPEVNWGKGGFMGRRAPVMQPSPQKLKARSSMPDIGADDGGPGLRDLFGLRKRPGVGAKVANAAGRAKQGLSRFFQRHLGQGEETPSWDTHAPGGTGSPRKPGEADPDKKYPVHKSARAKK